MDAAKKFNDDVDDADDVDVAYAATASVTTPGLFSVNTSSSAPNLLDDELVALQLKDINENNDFAPYLKLPEGKVNKK